MTRRLLLIEDDRWLAESYRRVLADWVVDIAVNGQEAMDLIDRHCYRAVIADVMLERGLVIDLLHELQAYDDTAHLPILLCTTLAQHILPADVAAYGVVAVLDKATLTPNLLRESLRNVLDSQ